MTKTVIAMNKTIDGKRLYVAMLFDRPIETDDMSRCRQIFARAVDAALTCKGVILQALDFENRYTLPRDFQTFPCNVDGYIETLRGKVTPKQRDDFGRIFQRLLNQTGKYDAKWQPRTVPRVRATDL